jgi:hypothetical protein
MKAHAVDEIVKFWFEELSPEDWYKADAERDAEVRRRFGPLYEKLSVAVPQDWLATPKGWLAAILVLDQFPRNMFRSLAPSPPTLTRLRLPSGPSPKVWICGLSPTSGHSFTCRFSMLRTEPIRRARLSCSLPSAIRTISILP